MEKKLKTMRIVVQVKPRSRETKLVQGSDGTLTMNVAAPPKKGKANRLIVKWLSKKLGKSSSQVQIVAGYHSNTKTVEILDVSEAELSQIIATA
jgi:hypothetical protein